MTKAEYARRIAAIVRLLTMEASALAEGMWNPDFCSNDASNNAKAFCDRMQHCVDELRQTCPP